MKGALETDLLDIRYPVCPKDKKVKKIMFTFVTCIKLFLFDNNKKNA